MTRLEQEYLHLSSAHKRAVIKIIEMNDSNGTRILHMVIWMTRARTKSMLITMKLTDFHREQN